MGRRLAQIIWRARRAQFHSAHGAGSRRPRTPAAARSASRSVIMIALTVSALALSSSSPPSKVAPALKLRGGISAVDTDLVAKAFTTLSTANAIVTYLAPEVQAANCAPRELEPRHLALLQLTRATASARQSQEAVAPGLVLAEVHRKRLPLVVRPCVVSALGRPAHVRNGLVLGAGARNGCRHASQ
jgi:hypothetical protein